nr:MAG TPA: hypothetical protein [Caudoviricetes sp.]
MFPAYSQGGVFPCTVQGTRLRGPFSHVREWPPFDPPRERKGLCPLTPTLRDLGLKRCTRCAIGCLPGVVAIRFVSASTTRCRSACVSVALRNCVLLQLLSILLLLAEAALLRSPRGRT